MKFIAEPKQVKDIALLKYAGASVMALATPYFSANALYPIAEDELLMYVEECHRLDVEAFIDVTRMFVDAEMERLSSFLLALKEMRVDGIYFADLSVYEIAREMDLDHLLIYQPDTLITNSLDAKLFLELGLQAVSIAKELTLEEVVEIASANPNQTEVVIHGVPLMSVSKRKLITNYFEEIGYTHEQKKYYHVSEDNRDARMPIFEDEQGTHMFGGYCLVSFGEIKTLHEANVKYARIQSNFIDTINTVVALQCYHSVLKGNMSSQDALALVKAKDTSQNYTSGFYYTRTSAKKEDIA